MLMAFLERLVLKERIFEIVAHWNISIGDLKRNATLVNATEFLFAFRILMKYQ